METMEKELHQPMQPRNIAAPKELDAPLGTDPRAQLKLAFMKTYGWPKIPANKIAADRILGRIRREFVKMQPTVLPVAKVRTSLEASTTQQTKRRKVSEFATITFNDADAADDRVPTCLLEFFLSLEVLFFIWAAAGSDEVQWDGEPVRFANWCHVTEYLDNLEERVLDMQPVYVEHSVVSWFTRVEEDFRGKAVELTRTPGSSIPWGVALLRAQAEQISKWEQRRYLLEYSLPSSVRSTGPRKGKGKTGGKKGGGLQVKVEETLPPPLRHRELAGQASHHKEPATCKTWKTKQLCKPYNDGRGCKSGKSCGMEHRCDVRLEGTNEACGARNHARFSHDPRQHGAVTPR